MTFPSTPLSATSLSAVVEQECRAFLNSPAHPSFRLRLSLFGRHRKLERANAHAISQHIRTHSLAQLVPYLHGIFQDTHGRWEENGLQRQLLQGLFEVFGSPYPGEFSMNSQSAARFIEGLCVFLQLPLPLSASQANARAPGWGRLWDALEKAGFLDENILEEVSFLTEASDAVQTALVDSIVLLSQSGLLNHHHFSLLCHYPRGAVLLAQVLIALNEEALFSAENFSALYAYARQADTILNAIRYLKPQGLFTDAHFRQLCLHSQEGDWLVDGLALLSAHSILTQENLTLLLTHAAHAYRLADVMTTLNQHQLLTPENRALLSEHPEDAGLLFKILLRLSRAQLLNQTRFEQVMQYRDVFRQRAFMVLLDNLPDHLVTAPRFAHWVALCEQHAQTLEVAQTAIRQDIEQAVHDATLTQVPDVNHAQSIHTTSVHTSVSESAQRLAVRYQDVDIRLALQECQLWLNVQKSTPHPTNKARAAQAAFARLFAPHGDADFIDRRSGLSTRQLLAYIWIGLCNPNDWSDATLKAQHQETQELPWVVFERCIQVLYECQRGYNLDANGVDNGLSDRPICPGGTFNKLMEILNTVHQDVQIIMMTLGQASEQLLRHATRLAKAYLIEQAQGATTEEKRCQFNLILENIQQADISAIWEAIQPQVRTILWDEFAPLFADSPNGFENLLCQGAFVELDAQALRDIERHLPALSPADDLREITPSLRACG